MKLSDFKVLNQDQHSYTVGHPKGKSIRVPKAGLSEAAHMQIKMMSEGGEVQTNDDGSTYVPSGMATAPQNEDQDAGRAPASIAGDIGSWFHDRIQDAKTNIGEITTAVGGAASEFSKGLAGPEASAHAGQTPQPGMPDTSQNTSPNIVSQRAPAAPSGGSPMGDMSSGIGTVLQGAKEEIAGKQEEAKAVGALGNQEASLAHEHEADMKNAMQDYQNNASFLTGEIENTIKDVKSNVINPNHYWESKSTPAKVATAIGLILGGIGGGLTGKENPALAFFNKQMDRDLEAQKMQLGQKETLLSANLKQFGNMHQAMLMTQAMQAGIYASKIDEAAAKSKDPIAAAQAKQFAAEIKQKVIGPNLNQLAIMKSVGNLGQSNIPPERKVMVLQKTGMMDPKSAEEAYKEIQKNKEVENLRSDLMGSFNDLNKRAFAGALSPRDRESAIQAYAGPIAKMAEGRFNLEESQNQMRALLPAPGESDETRKLKRQRLHKFFDSFRQSGPASAMGIMVPKIPDSSPTEAYK